MPIWYSNGSQYQDFYHLNINWMFPLLRDLFLEGPLNGSPYIRWIVSAWASFSAQEKRDHLIPGSVWGQFLDPLLSNFGCSLNCFAQIWSKQIGHPTNWSNGKENRSVERLMSMTATLWTLYETPTPGCQIVIVVQLWN